MNLLYVYRETISDGPGLRCAIYLAGCRHACPGCHNVRSWDPLAGIPLTEAMVQDIIRDINANPLLDGITISGGDPFYDPQGLLWLLRRLRAGTTLPIWCYTGYTIEELLADEALRAPLHYIDTLIDGRYVEALRDPHLSWRGSSNQRILRLRDYLSPES